jgi:phage terminase large subunit-like protein
MDLSFSLRPSWRWLRTLGAEAEYRNLVLNQRVESSSPFISPSVWSSCGGEPIDFRGKGVFVGLDLSETVDLTSAVFVHHDTNTGLWHVRPFFWLPGETLVEKSAHDRVSYDLWYQQGYLEVTPGASVSYEFLAERLREIFDDYEVLTVGYDPWGFSHLRPCLERAGFSERKLEQFVKFVQGTKSMSPALRELESLLLDRKLRHGNHPVLSWNANNATTEGPDASNRKLSKRRSSGRIDGLVALAIAIGVAPVVQKPKFDVLALLP